MGVLRAIRDFWHAEGAASRRDALIMVAGIAIFALLALGVVSHFWIEGSGEFIITYENRTSTNVTVMVNSVVEVTVPANDELSTVSLRDYWKKDRLVEAVDSSSGHVLFTITLDRADLGRMHNRIVITEQTAGY